MEITVTEGDGSDPMRLGHVFRAGNLAQAYDDYRAIKNLEHLREQANFVGGEGGLAAPIMVIGEAPGEQEDLHQRPFIGPAGELLRSELTRIGLHASEVFITNVVKYRPPGNRTPLYFEVEESRACVRAEIETIDPALIVLAGRTALGLFKHNASIREHQGHPFSGEGRLFLPIYHPSAALRDDVAARDFTASIDLIDAIATE
jgi:DNA polymerase